MGELMEIFPYPVLIFGFAEGVAKPSSDNSQQVTGLGINYGAALRPRVTDEFMNGLAIFHTADIRRISQTIIHLVRFDEVIQELKGAVITVDHRQA